MTPLKRSPEWREQWSLFEDRERFLFDEWIAPLTLDDFAELDVLEAGCGGGQHTAMLAEVARSVTAVDLNTVSIARRRAGHRANVQLVDDDITSMDLGRVFDVVICIGVIHHTDDPDAVFENLYRHCRPGGRVVVWAYSSEGNGLMRFGVEPFRKAFLRRLPRSALVPLARALTAALYPIVHTAYRLPTLHWLPYYEYFRNFRRLGFERNVLNVFDKLNAPQTTFTTRSTCERWFSSARFYGDSVIISRYAGVSYRMTGVKRRA